LELELEAVYAIADPLVVTVREPPLEGRPADYIGAIGRFDCGAAISPSEAKVGDPMTLTIWLRGTGTLDRATAPRLQDEPGIVEQFKVYDATEETDEDVRKFTYSLRPKVAGVAEFPEVTMAYFDVQQGEYVTLRTKPVPIEVSVAEQLQSRDIAVADAASRGGAEIEVRQEGIFANVTELSAVRDERVDPERWFLNLGGLAGLFLVVVAGKQQFDRRSADVGLARRRKAAGRARQRLDEADKRGEQSTPGAAADLVGSALVGLVADVCGISEQGLTSAEATRRLTELQVNAELCDRYETVLDECDAIRFGSRAGGVGGLVNEAGRVVDDVTAALRKLKHIR
jgi:hypothetical protein